MLTLSASPEGVLEQGKTYEVPDDVALARAQELVDGGAALLLDQPKAAKGKKPAAGAGPKSLDKQTVPELQAYAAENDIDLGDAKTRAEILAAIQAAETGD